MLGEPPHAESSPLLQGLRTNHHEKNEDNDEVQVDPKNAPPRSFLRSSSSFVSESIRALLLQNRDTNNMIIHPNVGKAAFLIRDAVLYNVENPAQGDYYDPYNDNNTTPNHNNENRHFQQTLSILCRKICSYRFNRRFVLLLAWIMVGLTLLEPPAWCGTNCPTLLNSKGPPIHNDNNNNDDNLTVSYYPNVVATTQMMITLKTSLRIESICVGVVLFWTLLKIGRDGCSFQRYLRAGPTRILRSIQLLCLLTMSISLLLLPTATVQYYHPYTRILLLATFLPQLRQIGMVLWKMVPNTFNILILVFVFMLFYAWFATVIFVDTVEGHEHFPSLVESMWTLWICLTTANYPDVMMPAYNSNPVSALFFVSFMVLTFFFFLNIVLASIVNEYETITDASQKRRAEMREQNLEKAFALMDPDNTGGIDRETVMSLFLILNEDFPEFRRLSEEETHILFAILDRDGSSIITREEFKEFGTILLLEFIRASDYDTFVQKHFPKLFESKAYQSFCDIVKSYFFELMIDVVLVLNAIVIAVQSYPELSGEKVQLDPHLFDGSIDTWWELLETIFTIIYVFEVIVKIMVFGWKRYSESQKNMFDLIITLLALIASAIVYYPNNYSDSRIIRMVIMARVLRLIRLLFALKRFQLIGMISGEILPIAGNVILALFFIMYVFAVIGVHLYGGMITRDPSNPFAYKILEADNFVDNDYWANNFNDMWSAMNVLFNLLVINNWTECEEGFEAVTGKKWVRFYFLTFHVAGVLFVNNLVIAVIINSFLQQLEILRQRSSEERVGDTVIRDRHALFEASEVTGTKTSLRGDFIARFRRSESTPQGHDQELLKHMFTRTSSSNMGEEPSTGSVS